MVTLTRLLPLRALRWLGVVVVAAQLGLAVLALPSLAVAPRLGSAEAATGPTATAPVRLATTGPALAVAGAVPGMAARRSAVRIENPGQSPARWALRTTDAHAALARALHVQVSAPDGRVLYAGTLAGARVSGGVLAAGATQTLTFTLTWPPSAADAGLQGATLALGLEIASAPVTV